PIKIEHVAAMFAATRDNEYGVRDRAIIAWLLDTGARAGGTVTVRVSDLDFARRRAFITEKGGKTRTVKFTEFTERLLKAWMEIRQPEVKTLFYNLQELEPLTTHGLRQILKRLRRRAKISERIYTHMFRHGFAQNFLTNGGNLATLFRLMGHADPATTVWYYTVFTEDELSHLHDEFSPVKQLEDEIKKPSGEG
ncbi:MAG: site-specific integrase, partial [Anaerolineae bacterium]|nr:site-specific integrase [Anaerolineae bacterium]